MSVKSKAELWEHRLVAYGTLILASATVCLMVATVWLALETRWLAKEWRDTSEKQVKTWIQTSTDQTGVQTWLALETRFDSKAMSLAMKELAVQLENYNPTNHGQVSEEVLEFFEDVGTLYNRGLLNKQLAASSFGYSATRWWEAARSYVYEERRRQGDDPTLFDDFEKFAKAIRMPGEKIDAESLRRFLQEEKDLKAE